MADKERNLLARVVTRGAKADLDAFNQAEAYVFEAPSAQNAIDLIPGWNHAFPPQFGLRAGNAMMFEDPRIHWAIEQFGPLEGRRVLELGPLEAAHTSMLDRLGPALIDSVEANKLAFLRCLIAKEVYGFKHVRFHLGDFVKWLERGEARYDLIIACGVLYHMENPLELLALIAGKTDAVSIWTHYFSEDAMPPGDKRRVAFRSQKPPFEERSRIVEFRGINVTLHERSYYNAWKKTVFCGGPIDLHYWMQKNDLLAVLAALGFDDVRVEHDDPGHVNGPAFSIFARRKS
jgi:hypothetical protein